MRVSFLSLDFCLAMYPSKPFEKHHYTVVSMMAPVQELLQGIIKRHQALLEGIDGGLGPISQVQF